MTTQLGMSKLHRKRLVSCKLPPGVRSYYTEGQAAVLAVVARVVVRSGECTLSYDRIALLAGVCVSTVRNAVSSAAALGHITVAREPAGMQPAVLIIDLAVWAAMIAIGTDAHDE